MLAAGIALVFASSAAAASFDAHGSVEQVYATGLPADASTSLLDSSDNVVATRDANDLGGILFRNVTPGDGYSVRLNSDERNLGAADGDDHAVGPARHRASTTSRSRRTATAT